MPAVNQALLKGVVQLCQQAGAAILDVYARPADIAIEQKADDSPVTAADMAAHHLLVPGLTALLDVPVLSEESAIPPYSERSQWTTYWLVDPLDGTKEFINRNGEFTVNVALVEQGVPVLGVVHVPVSNITYTGGQGQGARKLTEAGSCTISVRSLASRQAPERPVAVVLSRRHGLAASAALVNKLEQRFGPVTSKDMGSSLKLCLVAEGEADFYPRLAPTSEWDTAAAQAVVEAAGGAVLNANLEPLRYNQKDALINPVFYVVGDVNFSWHELLHPLED